MDNSRFPLWWFRKGRLKKLQLGWPSSVINCNGFSPSKPFFSNIVPSSSLAVYLTAKVEDNIEQFEITKWINHKLVQAPWCLWSRANSFNWHLQGREHLLLENFNKLNERCIMISSMLKPNVYILYS